MFLLKKIAMRKLLVILLAFFTTANVLLAQQTSWGFTIGGQQYEQERHYKSASLLTLENDNIDHANTIEHKAIRPMLGVELRKVLSNDRLLKFSTAYTTSEYPLDEVIFVTDVNGDIAGVDILPNVGTTRSRHGNFAIDYGSPLIENSEKWQLYIAGQGALTYEHINHTPNINALFSTSESFFGVRLGFAPDLTYQFDKMQLSMQLLIPFASYGFGNTLIENPNFTERQQRSTGIDFDLFGIKQTNLKIGVNWQI